MGKRSGTDHGKQYTLPASTSKHSYQYQGFNQSPRDAKRQATIMH